jgi:2-amino-4-hydroxy-6-hydroxymethyldihydropteridine diphosphokinase
VRKERWGPRTLDVDVLWIDGVTVDEPDLIVPHPRMFQRAFVLLPLRDLAPELVPADFVEPSPTEVRAIGNL